MDSSSARPVAFLAHGHNPRGTADNRLTDTARPADLTGKALFIDEAHHASADGLSQIVSTWRERGGQLFFFTATPYRGDGRPVALEGMRLFRRSLAEHMAEGFAPRHLDREIVALGRRGDVITASQFTGEDAPPPSYFDGLVTAICRKWVDDGKPKAIVRVPPMRGGSEGLVNHLLHALTAAGARTLDATGTAAEDKQRFLRALASEKDRTHAASRFDVMVGIQRVMEGTDWPVCSAVYCVGMPGSLNTVVQLLGRAMRLKGEDYPAEQRDRARLVFFVPCGGGAALADLSLDHSRHALLTCCFLADHAVGQEWIVLREVRRGIEEALGRRDENPAAADAENEADEALDPEMRAEVELAMASVREQIISDGGEPTLGEVVRLAVQARPDLPEVAFQRVAAEVLASQTGSTGDAAREAIHREVARRLRIEPLVKKAMEEAFAVVVDEFRAATLEGSAVLESIGRQVHGVTGGQMREFAQRLREATPRPLTEEQILGWADEHHQRTGVWPQMLSGPIIAAPDENWWNAEACLRKGLRGLQGGSSLAKLLAQHRGVRNIADLPPLTEEQILNWADSHKVRTGKWPKQTSGPVNDAPGETWSGINTALQSGGRGFPGGSSLARFLQEKRGTRNHYNLPRLTEEQILAWADAHHDRTGEWPKVQSGAVMDVPEENWASVNQLLQSGGRGLPGGSSVAKLLEKHRGVRNSKAPPPLTKDRILAWADAHYVRTGKWPRVSSGLLHGVADETWRGLDSALRHALRGLPGGSSLAQLLLEERGARNQAELPPLNKVQILSWADSHVERTGQWPTLHSGLIGEGGGEKWRNVDNALRMGLRGLPGGSSLAQLFAEERGAQNPAARPPLTKDQILAWADDYHDCTGQWPKATLGSISDAPDETWGNINQALNKGLRGLPGGSSLAQLLAEERGSRNRSTLPPLTTDQILAWADAHHDRTGDWPRVHDGPIENVSGETWSGVENALRAGLRGLPGGSSLAALLSQQRGKSHRKNRPSLTLEQILAWADEHHQRTGKWPNALSGSVCAAAGETWSAINAALKAGMRGLPGGSSLPRLIKENGRGAKA